MIWRISIIWRADTRGYQTHRLFRATGGGRHEDPSTHAHAKPRQGRFEPILISPQGELANEAGPARASQVIPLDVEGALNPLKDFSAAMALRKILNELKPDILHIHSAKAGLIGRFAARVKNRPENRADLP